MKPIRIAVDGRLLQGQLTGVGKYVLSLLHYVCYNSENITFLVYTNRLLHCEILSNKIVVKFDNKFMSRIKPMIWSKLFASRLINKDSADIYFAGDALLPIFLKNKKIVSVIHDFNSIIAPETMPVLRLITDKIFFKHDIHKAKIVIANSYGTAEKFKHYFKRSANIVIHPIIDDSYVKLDEKAVQEHLERLNINYPYLLTVSTQEPRKNMDKTIKAFIELKSENKLFGFKLLLIGLKGWKTDVIQNLLQSYKEDVISLGYVAEDMMPYIYNGAKLFLFPSDYEGFGMPAREAMLCGTTVVVSDIVELKEASYNKGSYVDPNNMEQFKRAIMQNVESGKGIDFNSLKSTDQLDQLISVFNSLT
jgi:glycosyltransferase involved in cell wall biosynthesis